jgi:DNA-binding NarL/FixJ family response regulator
MYLLTAREIEVMNNLVAGYTNREIATNLNVSIKCVENHLHIIFAKLRVKNRTQAAIAFLNIAKEVSKPDN